MEFRGIMEDGNREFIFCRLNQNEEISCLTKRQLEQYRCAKYTNNLTVRLSGNSRNDRGYS